MSLTLSDETLLKALQSWPLPEPPIVQRLPGGFTSEVWLVESGKERFAAKYAYQSQKYFDGGLYAAELVEQHGITSGAPLRTKEGALSLLVPGPHGKTEPLALLRFVPGAPLNLAEPESAALYGNLLGRTHRILLNESDTHIAGSIYDFIQSEEAHVTAQTGLSSLIHQAVEAARAYEARHPVTMGIIWGDRIEIIREQRTGCIGIIDWGVIGHGPLLFDIALSVLWLFPEGGQMYEPFLHAYFAEAPIVVSELSGLPYYKALLWARQAKYFAYRVFANVTLGGSGSAENLKSFTEARQQLEQLLAEFS